MYLQVTAFRVPVSSKSRRPKLASTERAFSARRSLDDGRPSGVKEADLDERKVRNHVPYPAHGPVLDVNSGLIVGSGSNLALNIQY
ncbi:hypothetical protein EVAR_80358_1 [Eumeta japonica]|uniref:Uncharacterized protein n=1 Tax=Eumeta variegata TaxID=151549 RepID=A0A4C1X2U5_EUMVA|nr:hypothetical protein EVAR_80358_1 [Eumeta japonica]